MIRTVLYLEPRGGDHGAVVDYYRSSRILERAAEVDGFVSSELHVPAEGVGAVMVTALWRDDAAYERWVEHPARARAAGELAELVSGDFDAAVRAEMYEVVLTQEPARGPGGGRG